MKKKILIIADFGKYGGTRTYFNNLLEYFTNKSDSIYLAAESHVIYETGFNFGPYPIIIMPQLKKIGNKGFFRKILNLLNFFFIQLLTLLVIWNEVRKNKIDLIVISAGDVARYLSILAINIPIIYVSHGTPFKSSLDKYYSFFLKITLNKKKRIVTVSKHMKEEITKIWGLENYSQYLELIYNGSKEISPSLVNSGIFKKNCILTLGHVRWYKNPDMWIRVAEMVLKNVKYREYQWIWAGDGELLEECRSMTYVKNQTGISFVGYKEQVLELYEKALIYFQPSILESFGLSVLDAMQMGLPCVVTRMGGLPELVVDGETGFIVDNGDIIGAAEKISWLLSNPKECERMGQAGYIRCRQLFSEDKWMREMERVLREIHSSTKV